MWEERYRRNKVFFFQAEDGIRDAQESRGLGISDDITSTFKTTVWEDNMGCLTLSKLKPGQYTPRSKHYAVKYHWFRSHLSNSTNRTSVEYVQSQFQLADILTKGLTTEKFRTIRKLLCGW